MNLTELGWGEFFERAFRERAVAGGAPARVVMQHRGGYVIVGQDGDLAAEVSGRFRHQARVPGDYPAVGDWVVMEPQAGEGRAIIHDVLPRRTKFSRTAAGDVTEEQVLATNIDEVFIVASLSERLNLRSIERYLTLAWASGASPVLVLTKSDVAAEATADVAAAKTAAAGAPVLVISSVTGVGLAAIKRRLSRGRTVALLGPSGAGKSTLINQLYGEEILDVQEVREGDGKGRHTTTQRELICLPSGALVIDTPGLRELQLWEGGAGIVQAFADIAALAAQCRFVDCRHLQEPGCAALRAVENGQLEARRLESYRKLQREQAYFDRKYEPRTPEQGLRQVKGQTRSLRAGHKTRR